MKKQIIRWVTTTICAVALLAMVSGASVQAAVEENVTAGAGVRFIEPDEAGTGTTDTGDSAGQGQGGAGNGHAGSSGGASSNQGTGGKTYFPQTGELAGGSALLLIGALIIGYVIQKKYRQKQS